MELFIEEQGLFWQYPVITEKTFYEQNKEDPMYLGLPWATILDKRYNIKELEENITPLLTKKVYYTCCQHISFRKLIPLFRTLGIKSVFSPHKKIGECVIDGVEILPCPLYAVNVEDVSRQRLFLNVNYKDVERPLWFSFVGGYQRDYLTTVRERLFEKYVKDVRNDIFVKKTGDWHFNELVYHRTQNKHGDENKTSRHVENTDSYNKILLQSRYSLCPSGTGPNSIRFWESLAVGAIPVLMSNYLELPYHADWDKAIVRVSENNIEELEEKLLSISVEKEKEMRDLCLTIYAYFKDNYKGVQYFALTGEFTKEQQDESFELIQKTIETSYIKNVPYFIGRVSYNEANLCGTLLSGKQPNGNLQFNMLWVAGIQFKEPCDIKQYVKAYTSAVNECDIVGVYDATLMYGPMLDFHIFMSRFMYEKRRFSMSALEPYRFMELETYRYMKLFENKRILIITGHADTTMHQINKDMQYHKKRLFPESASLQVYRAVQQNAKSNDDRSWKYHLEKMKEDLRVLSETNPYDVVLAGCGGYGMILSNYLHKDLKKSVIYVGGAIQLYFGIKGNRWKDVEYTEDWIYPLDSDKPEESEVCESGCYWGKEITENIIVESELFSSV
tara:strand:+ start:809 stop:2656 length:1848 start_codon:yes stop_codon:yes gene_type:complete